ncbi:MAG: hypothetical protein JW703_05385 [Candidatus Diapherotrites archaeon]|nr:hypothetical protein [Candidatus Diapherotrites archaeon]
MDLKEIKGKIFSNKKTILLLFILFLFAFGIRAHLMRFDLLFAFDSYFHARIASYFAQWNFVNADPLGYYYLAVAPVLKSSFFWMFNAIFYNILTLGTYSKESWILFVKFAPAFFGALTSVAMYFFGKEIFDKKIGFVMAFFAAVVPSFVYRTMAGFFEEDSLGFLWLVIGFVFFVRAIKEGAINKNSLINAGISVLFFALMAWTWDMFLLIPLVLLSYFGSTLFFMWFNREKNSEIIEFAKIFLIIFILFSVFATVLTGPQWINNTYNYVAEYLPITPENIDRVQNKASDGGVLSVTIGEENTGWQFFGEKYNLLIIFPLLAFILIPLHLIQNKKTNKAILIIFFWTLITAFMAYSKLKFTYTFGLPIAACTGIVFFKAFEFMQNRTSFEKKFIGLGLALMLLIGIGAASFFVTTKVPHIEMNTGWKETLYWVKDNTPTDAKIFNWWDEGHWITFISERKVIEDNRNYDFDADANVAQFILAESEEQAKHITDYYDSDYIVFGSDLLTKQSSLQLYAYNTVNTNDPRFKQTFGVEFKCNKNIDSLNGTVNYVCGSNTIPENEMNLFPTKYISQPNIFLDERTPGFVYREEDNSKIYILNGISNSTFMSHLWFNDPELKNYEEVYWNKDVKVFKVKK